MTPLLRTVRRKVYAAWDRTRSTPKDLVVSLIPNPEGGMIEVREKGRRKAYSVPVASLYTMLAVREADRARSERKAKRGKRV